MLDKKIRRLLEALIGELICCRDTHSDSKNYKGHIIFSAKGTFREPIHFTLINEICDVLIEDIREKEIANVS